MAAAAAWNETFHAEQHLIISSALVEVFSGPILAAALSFRGGTALYKLWVTPKSRRQHASQTFQTAVRLLLDSRRRLAATRGGQQSEDDS